LISYEWTSFLVAGAVAVAILWLVRRNQLHAYDAAWWLLLAGAIVVVGAFPWLVTGVARYLGISYSPLLVVILGFVVVLLRMLKLEIGRTDDKQKIRVLAQKVAILESRFQRESNENCEDEIKTGHQ